MSNQMPSSKNLIKKSESHGMKLLLELGPLLVFFFFNYKGQWFINNIDFFKIFDKPIFIATFFFIIATAIALIISWIATHKLPFMPLISSIFIMLFGILTLWLHNDIFIKMKPTIVNLIFSLSIFIGLYFNKYLLKLIFGSALILDDKIWRQLSWRFGFFFLFLAMVNEIVWRCFSTDIWASFKVFGVMPLTFIFFLFQTPLLFKQTNSDD